MIRYRISNFSNKPFTCFNAKARETVRNLIWRAPVWLVVLHPGWMEAMHSRTLHVTRQARFTIPVGMS